jgi:hypothetical protein
MREDPERMNEDDQTRQKICDRFAAVQDAVRSMHPLTIQLLNESRGIVYKSSKANLAPNVKLLGDGEGSVEQPYEPQPLAIKQNIA